MNVIERTKKALEEVKLLDKAKITHIEFFEVWNKCLCGDLEMWCKFKEILIENGIEVEDREQITQVKTTKDVIVKEYTEEEKIKLLIEQYSNAVDEAIKAEQKKQEIRQKLVECGLNSGQILYKVGRFRGLK